MIRAFFTRLVQRSDLVRFLVVPVLFLFFALAVSGVLIFAHRKPVIVSVDPSIASPGEVITIKGRHFGKEPSESWIEIAGDRISANSYLDWSDSSITTRLPETVSDGLVYVCSKNGRSNPHVFANRVNIPVAAGNDAPRGLPAIESFETDTVPTGQLLTIKGKNFGTARNSSEVRFAWQTSAGIPIATTQQTDSPSIACSDHDFDYEFWSDQELRVRVPDGAVSGNVFVKTSLGASNQMPITIPADAGTHTYSNKRSYLLTLDIDITGVSASDGNVLYVRVPVPETDASQTDVQVTASSPKPDVKSDRGSILQQLENLKTGKNEKISHSFLLTKYSLTTQVNPDAVKPYVDTMSALYRTYTAADFIVPSTNPDIVMTAAAIIQRESNPYLKAQLIYTWLTANISYRKNDNPARGALEALSSRTGDAYDQAILFAAIARASGIPAIPVAGILVGDERSSRVHWWAEFWIENFGWIPVDPGLAAERGANPKYFGSLDRDHIAFSRGWTAQKTLTQKGRTVYKPRSFAFRQIWEESGGNLGSYTSFWGDPKVTGVY